MTSLEKSSLPVFKPPNRDLWDISEDEDEDAALQAELEGNSLNYLINETFENKEDENEPEPPTIPSEKDIFGREPTKHRSNWKIRPENYGKIYNLMSGVEVPMSKDYSAGGQLRSASHVKYLEQLYKSTDTDISKIICPDKSEKTYRTGAFYKSPIGYTFRGTPGTDFRFLTTFDVQCTICAALNSKIRLEWIIGADQDGKINGCLISYEERDCFRQGLDFALSTEFIPVLKPELVDINFLPVDPEYDPDLHLIKISVCTVVSTLYQLSSGRIFYTLNGYPRMLDNMNQASFHSNLAPVHIQARLMLLDRKQAEKKLPLEIVAPTTKPSVFLFIATAGFSFGALVSYALCKRYS